jgi:hypothetical protein
MKRLIEFDVLRAILLLMMVVNHSPSQLRRFTDQPFGFFTTAEAFVFVSAFLAGMLFLRRAEKDGFTTARLSTVRRAWRIYRAHLLTLAFAFVVGSFFSRHFPGVRNMLDHYLTNQWMAIPASMILVLRPPLMDILPMYILFSLLTPVAFWAARKWGWKIVILLSAFVWLGSQTRVTDLLGLACKDISYVQLGPFDLLAWQFLWICGLCFGQRFQGNGSVLTLPMPWTIGCGLLSVAFLAWRWSSTSTGIHPDINHWLLDKWHLGILRLINFFVTGWVISKFLRVPESWEIPLRPLSQIGRHMLPVFCCQICVSILLVCGLESRNYPEWLTTFLVICQLATVFLLAWFFETRLPELAFLAENFRSTQRISATIYTCGSQPRIADFVTNLFRCR